MTRGFDASAHYGRRIADVHDDGITVKDPPGVAGGHPAASGFPVPPGLSEFPPSPSRSKRSLPSPKAGRAPALPAVRGPITSLLFERLARPPHRFGLLSLPLLSFPARFAGPVLVDEDVQLALFVCYELYYRGFDGVDDRWEWNPSLLEVREILEARFEEGLARAVPYPPASRPEQTCQALAELVAAAVDGPDLAGFLQRQADLAQFREFVAHRSIHHLKEADPYTPAIPRLSGRTKAAPAEIQAGAYGGGAERMRSELFRTTMRELDMDDSYGAYLDRVPAITLAVSNTLSLFELHRRHLGALLGHLAAFEMTSSVPDHLHSLGLRRLDGDEAASRFHDEHVRADAVHEQTAAHDMCGEFATLHPSRAGDVLYGAACALTLDRLFAEHVMSHWRRGTSSLREAGAATRS
ncbi:iron-containing redox enzyme family protein [Streptosporangium sp. NBC_01495]|uniref:iron-containing redox enzyme family protein n=1 Tax=Streptosporangium sp. NBC_01495 TaxID=2903899 RepID=UPI002E2F48E9|nr:iron-containing redox enzyme family protein [Streptosporangium sp. NBC_01495]